MDPLVYEFTTSAQLSPAAQAFRARIHAAVGRDLERWSYIDADTWVAVCPVCGRSLAVRFHGAAARADLHCGGGCTEGDILDTIKQATS